MALLSLRRRFCLIEVFIAFERQSELTRCVSFSGCFLQEHHTVTATKACYSYVIHVLLSKDALHADHHQLLSAINIEGSCREADQSTKDYKVSNVRIISYEA